MFGRQKKPDGFEWHKYIRTTIRLKREQRRERVLEARRAAGQQASAAGAALAQGSRAAGAAAWDGARAGLGVAGLVAQSVWTVIAAASVLAGQRLAMLAQPLIAALARPNIGGPIALAGAIALGSGIGRYRGTGLDGEASITLGIGIALLIASLPLLSGLTGIRMPGLPSLAALGIAPRIAGIAVAIAVVAGGVAWFASGAKTNLAGIAGQLPLVGGAKPLQGRAEALSGDLMRVAGTTVRLAGIEAPERQQTCGAGGRRYPCGAAAQAALARLVSGRALSCTLSGTDSAGRPLASCTRGTMDINGELVRQGHVFAASGLFASYSGLEREARAAKAGIWAGGEAERPSEFRAKVWEEAKRRAPDGCPIKGLVTGRERVYVLPWAPDYERGRIQKTRGERWFCSEQEAVGAGWKPAVRG
jgi:endonuclease YncB( thermonuclease family)